MLRSFRARALLCGVRAKRAGSRSRSPTGRRSPREWSHSRAWTTFWAGSKRCSRRTAACSTASTFVRIIPETGFPGEIPALKIRCECRKPGTLLLRRALAELPIDRRRSMLIGDSLRDIGAARGVGIWAYGVRTGHGCRDRRALPPGDRPRRPCPI